MNSRPIPLVLLFGPSGAGKSTLCAALSNQSQWLHVETDPFSRTTASAPVPKSLLQLFSPNPSFSDLATELRGMASSHSGVILSFISMICPNVEHITAAQESGFTTIFLSGNEQECLRSFLRREARIGRNLPEQHWRTHSTGICRALHRPEYAPHTMLGFSDGAHRSVNELVAEVLKHVSG
ncbi:(d)CMP kinase [Undibacterium flavidum]|uniref:(D)CMP kinase n=1 Tax=Undibacterium flavidum TaxID=2762297 RepID=A0ABR6YHC6_9BURK|nr:(d)CMP kinase [Undibacterium flavidum]MBC3875985.1 (d)CMP kinase [Undibacterium flavidum]